MNYPNLLRGIWGFQLGNKDGLIRLLGFPLLLRQRTAALTQSDALEYEQTLVLLSLHRRKNRVPQSYTLRTTQLGLSFTAGRNVPTSGHVLSLISALSVPSVLPLRRLSVPRQSGGSTTNIIIHSKKDRVPQFTSSLYKVYSRYPSPPYRGVGNSAN